MARLGVGEDESTAVFHAGVHVGYTFDGSGTGTKAKSLTLSSSSNAPYSSRTVPYGWVKPGNGIWFAMSDGYFAGTWVRESPSVYARGFVDRLEYYWNRSLAVPAGSRTAYQFDGAGVATGQKSASTGATAWAYAARARINGRPSVYLTSGPLAGYWLPVGETTATSLSATVLSIPSTDDVGTTAQDGSGARIAAPTVEPDDPTVPAPMPGQQELGPVDGPPQGPIEWAP